MRPAYYIKKSSIFATQKCKSSFKVFFSGPQSRHHHVGGFFVVALYYLKKSYLCSGIFSVVKFFCWLISHIPFKFLGVWLFRVFCKTAEKLPKKVYNFLSFLYFFCFVVVTCYKSTK